MLYLWGMKQQGISKHLSHLLTATPHKYVSTEQHLPDPEGSDVVLVFGNAGLEKLQAAGLCPKNRKIGSMRGHRIPFASGGSGGYILTWEPGYCDIAYEARCELLWDARLALRLHDKGTTAPVLGDYKWVSDLSEAIAGVEAQYAKTGKRVDVAVDIETVTLDWVNPANWIVSFQVSYKPGQALCVHFGDAPGHLPSPLLLEQITWLLTNPKVSIRGANIKYDLLWIRHKWGIVCTNCGFDVVLVGSLLDENQSNSLKMLTKIHTDMGGYDEVLDQYDKSRMDLIPKDVLLSYAGGDPDATLRVSNVIKPMILKEQRLANFYVKLLHPASRAMENLEYRGVYVDQGYYKKLREEVEAEIASLFKQALDLLPRRIRLKYIDNLSLDRDAILIDYLFSPMGLNLKPVMFTAKKGAPSTAMDHLSMFAEHPEAGKFIALLKEWNSAKKTLGTYIVGFMKHIRADGKFHPTYLLYRGAYGEDDEDSGAVTGRTSVKDPAYQTIPKRTKWSKKLRAAFVPPPGHVILKFDFSQGELRIAACLAEEETMLKAYNTDFDLHLLTACKVKGITFDQYYAMSELEQVQIRTAGKTINFGLIYGMGADGFVEYSWKNYGVKVTIEEAIEFIDKFFGLYPRLRPWHKKYKDFAHKYGHVISPLGRIRHLPMIHSFNGEIRSKAERQAVNSPVQSALSDLSLLSMGLISKEFPDLHQFGMTHDELAFYVPQGEELVWGKKIKDLMENLPLKQLFGWVPQTKFVVDVELGIENMGKTTKLKV